MATPLLLVVHGRAGGVVPAELTQFADELAGRRGTPVFMQALTAPVAREPAALPALTLVPLMLLPGTHVRQDVPAIAQHWRRLCAVRRLPFVGAWPAWQQALRDELAVLHQGGNSAVVGPLLLHHPLEGTQGARYLRHLAQVTGAQCQPTPYSAEQLEALALTLDAPALPLALAANRLTDRLGSRVGAPLLQRTRFRQVLLQRLEALP